MCWLAVTDSIAAVLWDVVWVRRTRDVGAREEVGSGRRRFCRLMMAVSGGRAGRPLAEVLSLDRLGQWRGRTARLTALGGQGWRTAGPKKAGGDPGVGIQMGCCPC